MAVKQYFSDHWRGRHGLATSLLVSALGLRVGLGWLQSAVLGAPVIILVGYCLVANVVVLAWQVVGALRASNAHVSRTGDVMVAWAGYGTALIVAVLAILQTADIAATLGRKPFVVESVPEERRAQISPDASAVTLEGELDYNLNTAFRAALERADTIRTVILSSDGGFVFAARAVAYGIREHGLDTHVAATCSSACTIAFMAGGSRTLGPEGQLGFHRYRYASTFGVATVSADEEIIKDRDFFLSRGVSADFLARALAVEHSDIWFPTRAELFEAGVVTRD